MIVAHRLSLLRSMAVGALALAGCEDVRVAGQFTSRVVQHDLCRLEPDGSEVCAREELLLDVRVTLLERAADNVWLSGFLRGGASDRVILGSRDQGDGFLFVDRTIDENDGSGCIIIERLELRLAIEDEVDPARIGTDPCVALVGRETVVTELSAGCDAINDPPEEQVLVVRRRWEKPPTCG